MSDIFISYKREEQPVARKLADALESEGWTVWWDPKLRAGDDFDAVIEKGLTEAKCVIVIWSNLSVNSEYVKAEATEALEQKKLVPIKIDNVNLPFRFKRVHTPSLLGWDGSKDFSQFRKLVEDISTILGPSPRRSAEAEERLKLNEERLRKQGLPSEEDSRRRDEQESRRSIAHKYPWRAYLRLAAAIAVVLTVFSVAFQWLVLNPRQENNESVPVDIPPTAGISRSIDSSTSETISAVIYSHKLGFTREDAETLQRVLENNGIRSRILVHRDPNPPDAVFIGALVGAKEARIAISSVPYEIKYIFGPDYPGTEGGDPSGLLIGIGYLSSHFRESRGPLSEPVKVSALALKSITEPGLSNAEFQRRLRNIEKWR